MLTFDEIPGGTSSALMILSSPRTYLNDKSTIGTGETWSFSYNLTFTDTSGSSPVPIEISVPVSGSYKDMGMATIEAMGDTWDAWHIQSDYSMILSTIAGIDGVLEGFSRDYPAQADYYWVEDIGLVKEQHTDTETGAIILKKEITALSACKLTALHTFGTV